MTNVKDFAQEKLDREQPSLSDVINGLTAHNCDRNRPVLEQQPMRAQMPIEGLTRRDIKDCMVLGILECKDPDKYESLPKIYVSDKGTHFKDFESLDAPDEGYGHSYVDPERVTYNDLYGWNLDEIDPVAAVQNMACHLEHRLGIFPALIDGKLTIENLE